MTLKIPALSVVVLIGTSGSGKTSFAHRLFKPTEVLSSDFFRGLVADDENSMTATPDAFETLHFILEKRLAAGRLTVIDATNCREEDRAHFLRIARKWHALPVAIVLDVEPEICVSRNEDRQDRPDSTRYVMAQQRALHRSIGRRGVKKLRDEGFTQAWRLSPEQIDAAVLDRVPLWCDRRNECGPFDIIGDVHGCFDELCTLLAKLGYQPDAEAGWRHPEGRKAVFLGDLVDRGPRSLDCLFLAAKMHAAGQALCVPGNHEAKLLKAIQGKKVTLSHGLKQTLEEFDSFPDVLPEDLRQKAADFIGSLVAHLVLDHGKLIVAHAGLKQSMQGRASPAIRAFALYGETTGEIDEFGLPVRADWAAAYKGEAAVIYGHTPVPEAEWVNGTLCLDTGCVFGGRLSALRWPERAIVSVPAQQVWCEPVRPLAPVTPAAPHLAGDVLDLAEVSGKRTLTTRLISSVTVRAEESSAALETMSRFAADPRWLIHLPPTMSPPSTSSLDGFLEHPAEAFDYFRKAGVRELICEEKHMGSRAVIVICRDAAAATRRFQVEDGRAGIILSRTGRAFFPDSETEDALLQRLRLALDRCGWWDRFGSDWFCLDCELMPWSAKAKELLRGQYAAVAAAASASLSCESAAWESLTRRLPEAESLAQISRDRQAAASQFRDAYRRYCWEVDSIEDYRLAPFHLLAAEGECFASRDHAWHMNTLAELAEHDPILVATAWKKVDLDDETSVTAATDWWLALTAKGGEGMVVKPLSFIAHGDKGLVQPAIKCRGKEYLRIIYGPEYDRPDNLSRLRQRSVAGKRSLALREFALGLESLERFVRRESLRRVHECVFAVLALESDPIDPRL